MLLYRLCASAISSRPGRNVLYRYIHDGRRPAFRQQHADPYITGSRAYERGRLTRFVPLNPSSAGPLLYCDDDGTVDVQMTDRDGQPWFWYRAREGRYTIPTYPKSPTVDGKLTHPLGEFPYGDLRRIPWAYRGTGMLTPLGLPWSPFPNGRPWYSYVVEQDILAGRRGVAGWDGGSYDRGLWLGKYVPPHISIDWSDPMMWLYAAAGVAAVLALAATGVGLIALAGGGLITASVVLGLTTATVVGMRLAQGQTVGQSFKGAFWDMTGVSSVYAGIYNEDIETGEYLGLSSGQLAFSLGMGAGQLGLTAYGAYRLGKAGVGAFRNWRASRTPAGTVTRYHYGPEESIKSIAESRVLEARDIGSPAKGTPKAWVTKITPEQMRGQFGSWHRMRLGFSPSKQIGTPHLRGGRLVFVRENAFIELRIPASQLHRAPLWKALLGYGAQEYIVGNVPLEPSIVTGGV